MIDSTTAKAMPETGPHPRHGHTELDYHKLVEAGVDPASTQPRERAVPCSRCAHPTFNQSRGCDAHYTIPGRVVIARGEEQRRSDAARYKAVQS